MTTATSQHGFRPGWHIGPVLCLLAASNGASAIGLQVTPTSLSVKASEHATAVWLSNTGDGVIHAQVRVYRWTEDQNGDQLTPSAGLWTQNEHGDQLSPSSGLVVSPPMAQVGSGDQQMIRVIRVGAPASGPGAVEEAYRLAIDELPIDAPAGPGLHFVVHYSVPVFVEPAGAKNTAPQLQWSLRQEDQHAVLQVTNSGNGHAQLANLSFVDSAGHRTEVDAGLLGYVLPGATMHWVLKPPAKVFAPGGTLEIMINGRKATQNLPLASRSP
jgi:fimbrial chaperone protein